MVLMKEKNVEHNTKHVQLWNLHARTSNVFENNIDAMEKMIAVIIQMKLVAVSNLFYVFGQGPSARKRL